MQRLFKKYKDKKSNISWESYKSARNEYQNNLTKAEDEYRKERADSLAKSKNTKTWWNTAKWLLGKGRDTSYPPLEVNGKKISDNKMKADAFNEFFLSHSNVDTANAELPPMQNVYQGDPLDSIIVTENEVLDLLKSIDTSKATGPDGISPKLLKEAGSAISPSLAKLFNLSLSKCKIPKEWKKADVVPLHKKNAKTITDNYRPVSLLSCVSKLLERLVFKHMYNYFKEHFIISIHQSGFKIGDSTVHQLSYLYHMFCSAIDEKKDVRIVFCDIKKAFDRVWHTGLLYKLEKCGITGPLLKWLKDYLSERYQRVIVKGQSSDWGLIKAGVPQGSVLGPLLFLIYINDITAGIDSEIKLFADDTTIYIDVEDSLIARDTMNNDLQTIQEWANQWLVTFCPRKTESMTISFKKNQNAVPLNFGRTPSRKSVSINI